MRYNIKGKNMEIGERTKEKVSDKLDRAKKLFPEDAEATVVIKNEKLEYIVEVTIPMSKRVVRAEVSADDMMTAVDKAVDIIERQIVRYKKRLKTQMKKNAAFKAEYDAINIPVDDADDDTLYKIEKSKKFEIRPMSAEEAVMQMELLGHSFFVFRNDETELINVVYKRKDGSFGLIEPE
ncbi:ribosome hibernation-promoting factor, HPF/YfiA family [Anaerotignum sp. MSJ-24]|uniref:ribosome hibernation-promoting factor, HPF/YfiA family n=1 Tax=Anaerotignum sp. MSJ-24 TaxID=2841521 RepID=UPI001C1292FB|nr:ribosome-associated translation inhibitor RaiA [Anaerotignum sp. MSJ-24]MBU5463782.1 ribosome-associated translation inhibitor RaiA [Anaerotignum sp. MSJ-24]